MFTIILSGPNDLLIFFHSNIKPTFETPHIFFQSVDTTLSI